MNGGPIISVCFMTIFVITTIFGIFICSVWFMTIFVITTIFGIFICSAARNFMGVNRLVYHMFTHFGYVLL